MESALAQLQKLDRKLLIIYLIAILALLLLPVSEPHFRLLHIKSDKWMHVALFGGCALLLRWNLGPRRWASLLSIVSTVFIAAAMEVAQGFTTYRDAEWADVLAGGIGAVLGVIAMNRILASPKPDRSAGALVVLLGIMIVAASVLADVFGPSSRAHFGPIQVAGTVLGALLVVGGAIVVRKGLVSRQ